MTAPTIQTLQQRVALLEEQLALSEAGAARLAQRCLALEQEVARLEPAPEDDKAELNAVLVQPRLFFDTGAGFNTTNMVLSAQPLAAGGEQWEKGVEVTAVFLLPKAARRVRIDPGELPCLVRRATLEAPALRLRPLDAVELDDGGLLFAREDPVLMVEGADSFEAGAILRVHYLYYPLDPDAVRPLTAALLQAQNSLSEALACAKHELDAAHQLLGVQQGSNLPAQLQAMTDSRDQYKANYEAIQASMCWRLTAPLRWLLSLLHKG